MRVSEKFGRKNKCKQTAYTESTTSERAREKNDLANYKICSIFVHFVFIVGHIL